jgi:hypothetical protein
MRHLRNTGRALVGAALLTGSLAGCNDFIEQPDSNPDTIGDPTAEQSYVGSQVGTFFVATSDAARYAGLLTQHASGVDPRFASIENREMQESDIDAMWENIYAGAGLFGTRQALIGADRRNLGRLSGILRIQEAFLFGLAASFWGDVPYTEALQTEIRSPKLDPQEQVYASLQAKLDSAISQLNAGRPISDLERLDLNFGGEAELWVQVAHTLKARFYLHWADAPDAAKANVACGVTNGTRGCLEKARAATANGVKDAGDDWTTRWGTSDTELNPFFIFDIERSNYWRAGFTLVNLMNNGTPATLTDDDPRTSLYFSRATGTFAGQFLGSSPGTSSADPEVNASRFEPNAGPGSSGFNTTIVGCAENYFIQAEANYRLGNEPAARTSALNALGCSEEMWGVSLTAIRGRITAATGAALYRQIMEQKYIALLLNPEVYTDVRRTCTPGLAVSPNGEPLLGRFVYPGTERLNNSSVPAPSAAPVRNANIPATCTG